MFGEGRMQVILHGDDMGATRQVTERLLEGWRAGLLSSFSVLANGEAVALWAETMASHPGEEARIVAHLNLSEGPATSPGEVVPRLVDGQGRLCRDFGDLLRELASSRAPARRALLDQIEAEWSAQIEVLQGLCRPRRVAALDGHRHVHMLPLLFPLTLALARRHGIGEVRFTSEPFHLSRRARDSLSPAFPIRVVKYGVLQACALISASTLTLSGVSRPDAIVGVLYGGQMTAAAALAGIAAARARGARRVEVIFHIGRASPAELSRWGALPRMASFFASPARDLEYEELKKLVDEAPWLIER